MINSTNRIMITVLLALLPGTLVSTYLFGPMVLANLVVCVVAAVITEAICLSLRKRPLTALYDGSALVTGALIALALPAGVPLWMPALGSSFAILIGKQLYGGLGHNPFNPAMVGYAMLLISFPLAMSTWPTVTTNIDGITAATPLDTFKFRSGMTIEEIWQAENGFGGIAGIGWQWINLAYLLGGAALIYLKAARWQAPVAMLATLTVLSIFFYDNGSSNSLGSPLFHLFSGGTMLAAFFIVTDPVSSPDSHWGLISFGIGVGVITFIIRVTGAYPDGVAFAVLLMNAATPLMDQLRYRTA